MCTYIDRYQTGKFESAGETFGTSASLQFDFIAHCQSNGTFGTCCQYVLLLLHVCDIFISKVMLFYLINKKKEIETHPQYTSQQANLKSTYTHRDCSVKSQLTNLGIWLFRKQK